MIVAHPNLEVVDQIVRIVGWPAAVGAFVWAIRKWDTASMQWNNVRQDTTDARVKILETYNSIQDLKTNHLAHLQAGIEAVAKSNDLAVGVLQDISKGISVLVDRTKR